MSLAPTLPSESTLGSGTSVTTPLAATGDTGPTWTCEEDASYPDDDDCIGISYYQWDVDGSCWDGAGERRPLEWWSDFDGWECYKNDRDSPYARPLVNYWIADPGMCAEFVELVDECAVGDPAIRPCTEAPFDCCGIADSWTAPICP